MAFEGKVLPSFGFSPFALPTAAKPRIEKDFGTPTFCIVKDCSSSGRQQVFHLVQLRGEFPVLPPEVDVCITHFEKGSMPCRALSGFVGAQFTTTRGRYELVARNRDLQALLGENKYPLANKEIVTG